VRFGFEGHGCFPTGKHYPGIAHLLKVAAAGLAEEFERDLLVQDLEFVSIDTETTGTDATRDRIVEIACVRFRAGQIVSKQSWLINPERPIPQEAFEVHGISDDHVKDQPVFARVAAEVLAALAGAVPLAYNAEFDQGFLHQELQRAGHSASQLPPAARQKVQWIDPLIWARELHKDAKSKALGAMAELLGVELETAHRATDDAAAAALVMARFFGDTRVPRTYSAFMQEQRRLGRVQRDDRPYWRSA
jgi:DNA polymerase III subunit epsilon